METAHIWTYLLFPGSQGTPSFGGSFADKSTVNTLFLSYETQYALQVLMAGPYVTSRM